MKAKGINYDVGTCYMPGVITRRSMDKRAMAREIRMIRNQLHCNSVRIYGEMIDRMAVCSEIAFENGLWVWLSPRFINRTEEETLELIKKCARKAERLRKANSKIVLIIGNELTLDTKGIIAGATYNERVKTLMKGQTADSRELLNRLLRRIVTAVRKAFRGKITYAAGSWEKVDWDIFDIVGVNKYLAKWNKETYRRELRELERTGKPVAITEFGCGSYAGAADRGPSGYDIVDWTKREIRGKYRRSEDEQANYIRDLLQLLEEERIDAAFVYTFMEPHYVYSEEPGRDLDMASFNVVRVHSDGHIEPKRSFRAISEFYRSH